MRKPVRTTVIFGLISAVLLLPMTWLLMAPLGWPMAIRLTLWVDLAVYSVLLVRWSKKPTLSVMFPLALLLGAALWPDIYMGFFLMGLGILSWIRSGICFTATPVRSIFAELVTVVGSAVLIAVWGPHSYLTWAFALWLFFLFQALYFFFVPGPGKRETGETIIDPFDNARQKLEGLLDSSAFID